MEASTETRLHSRTHGSVAMRAAASLARHVEAHGLGVVYAVGTGFQLVPGSERVVGLDVAFVRRERLPGDNAEYVTGAPDLVMEVVEPDDSFESVTGLLGDLLGAGCPMVVIINPIARTSTVFRSNGRGFALAVDDVLDGGDVVPGWKLVLRDIFA